MATTVRINLLFDQLDPGASRIARDIGPTRSPKKRAVALSNLLAAAAGGSRPALMVTGVYDCNATASSATVTCTRSTITQGVRASGTVTVANNSNVTTGDTVTVAGQVFTCVASNPGANQFIKGSSASATASNLAAAIQANTAVTDQVSVSVSVAVISFTAVAPGTAGNSIGLATNDTAAFSLSGATLTGGVNGDTLNIGGRSLTCVNTNPVAGTQFVRGANDAELAANLAACINENPQLNQVVNATAASNVVTVRAIYFTPATNLITISSTVNSGTPLVVSGPTLSGYVVSSVALSSNQVRL